MDNKNNSSTVKEAVKNARQKFLSFLDKSYNDYKRLGLKWNYRSVKYIIDNTPYCFEQLANCVFFIDGEPKHDFLRGAILCVESALAGQGLAIKEIRQQADDILEQWTKKYSIEMLWYYCMNQIEDQHHFFLPGETLKMMLTKSSGSSPKNLGYIRTNKMNRLILERLSIGQIDILKQY